MGKGRTVVSYITLGSFSLPLKYRDLDVPERVLGVDGKTDIFELSINGIKIYIMLVTIELSLAFPEVFARFTKSK